MDLYVITGASRGLGWCLVQQVAKRPDTAILAVSRGGVPTPNPSVQDVRCDLSSKDGLRTAAAAASAKLGERTWDKAVLINNAGMVEPVAPIERCAPDQLERNISLNLTAAVVLMQAFVAASRAVPRRSIVNISSGAGRRPIAGWTAYCATKAGLDMASRVAALEAELNGTPLRVTSLAPGVLDTAMQGVVRAASQADFPTVEEFRALKAQGALVKPEDAAARILELEQAGKLPNGLAYLREL